MIYAVPVSGEPYIGYFTIFKRFFDFFGGSGGRVPFTFSLKILFLTRTELIMKYTTVARSHSRVGENSETFFKYLLLQLGQGSFVEVQHPVCQSQ